jgi:hypothetical protein
MQHFLRLRERHPKENTDGVAQRIYDDRKGRSIILCIIDENKFPVSAETTKLEVDVNTFVPE